MDVVHRVSFTGCFGALGDFPRGPAMGVATSAGGYILILPL